MSLQIDLVIKFGGSAITQKDCLETPIVQSLQWAAKLIKSIHQHGLSCVVVHGAGSFGHHQAKLYKVLSGYLEYDESTESEDIQRVKHGFCLTRQSVLKLNKLMVDHLLVEEIPAVSISPFPSWVTNNKEVSQHGCDVIKDILKNSFIPVLHGDGVLDETLGCTILSGDTIIQRLCVEFDVKKVVFITDVAGIYNKPPTSSDALLLPKIYVNSSGDISSNICMSEPSHDVTGGIRLKLQTAINILKQSPSIHLMICQVGTESAFNICTKTSLDDQDFIGTEVKFIAD